MANKTPLASWLYTKRNELSPSFTELKTTSALLPGLFDFSTEITWNGITAKGRGLDSHREIALEKAVAESFERLICMTKNIDSTGMAVSGGAFDPRVHAKNELLERFYLKNHLRNHIPFKSIPAHSKLVAEFKEINPAVGIQFYQMLTPASLHGVVCKLQGNGQTSFGFSFSDSLEKAVELSLVEAIPSFLWLTTKNIELSDKERPWHVSESFFQEMTPLLSQTVMETQEACPAPNVGEVDFDFSEISVFKNSPLTVARFAILADGETI
ncbi:MAG: hypothetical protein JNL11_17010 [Bdellovibrionaceae bacterium]|nr:hypothetical protein [Pseudobdellovibrionaceae bacterium]